MDKVQKHNSFKAYLKLLPLLLFEGTEESHEMKLGITDGTTGI
jgi:hypothetical protein